jgi:hypothetical protein
MSETDDTKPAAEGGDRSQPGQRDEVGEPGSPQAPAEPQSSQAPTESPEPTPAPAVGGSSEPPHILHARRFWILSIVNWAIAIICWGVSSYLGVTSPANMFVYTILFVVGIVAVIVGFLCWLVARFGTEPPRQAPEGGGAR